VADRDLAGWIDRQLEAASDPPGRERLARMREALIGPLRHVYGVSDKVLSMALACVLLSAPKKLPRWGEVGGSMIAIDTLNHLHRTGILRRFRADHAYGAACYQPGGCAEIIERWPAGSMLARSTRLFPRPFRGSSSMRSGGTVPSRALVSAMAIGLTTERSATTQVAKSTVFAIVLP
jgi:hypothetical protein